MQFQLETYQQAQITCKTPVYSLLLLPLQLLLPLPLHGSHSSLTASQPSDARPASSLSCPSPRRIIRHTTPSQDASERRGVAWCGVAWRGVAASNIASFCQNPSAVVADPGRPGRPGGL